MSLSPSTTFTAQAIQGFERANHARGLDGIRGVGASRRTDEGLLHRAQIAPVVARAAEPGGRNDALVIGDLLVLDDDPVPEGSAGGLDQSLSFTLKRYLRRSIAARLRSRASSSHSLIWTHSSLDSIARAA